jgi:flavin reductase (DIM6/NTAB) family NADH-FMN oxidoreductase RutF
MPDISPVASALGRIASGLFIVTTTTPAGPLGFLGSFVMQAGFNPPTVSVAVGKDRAHLAAMRASGRFSLSVIDKDSSGLMRGFFKKLPEGMSPYDGLALSTTDAGSVVLDGALAWLDCKVSGEHETGDHVIVFGVVEHAALVREGQPSVHLRKNGLGY